MLLNRLEQKKYHKYLDKITKIRSLKIITKNIIVFEFKVLVIKVRICRGRVERLGVPLCRRYVEVRRERYEVQRGQTVQVRQLSCRLVSLRLSLDTAIEERCQVRVLHFDLVR